MDTTTLEQEYLLWALEGFDSDKVQEQILDKANAYLNVFRSTIEQYDLAFQTFADVMGVESAIDYITFIVSWPKAITREDDQSIIPFNLSKLEDWRELVKFFLNLQQNFVAPEHIL